MVKTGNMLTSMNRRVSNSNNKAVEDLVVLADLVVVILVEENIPIHQEMKEVSQIFLNLFSEAQEEEEARQNIADRILMQN